jgi:hypothetical protein
VPAARLPRAQRGRGKRIPRRVVKFTTATDGTSEWVRPEDVERFTRDGAALLGKEAQVDEGAISQLGAMHQQLTESHTGELLADLLGQLLELSQ